MTNPLHSCPDCTESLLKWDNHGKYMTDLLDTEFYYDFTNDILTIDLYVKTDDDTYYIPILVPDVELI